MPDSPLTTTMPVGELIEVLTSIGGPLRVKVGPAAGVAFAPSFIQGNLADQSFNGSGAGGATVLSPITVIAVTGLATDIVYNFLPAGVAAGWLVFFNVEGTAGSLTIENNGGGVVTVDTNNPVIGTENPSDIPFPQLYFNGVNWRLLRSHIQGT